MKRIIINILWGLLVILAVTIMEIVVTVPFGGSEGTNPGNLTARISIELLLTSVPAALITMGAAWLTKAKTKKDALLKSSVWTVMLLFNYVLIGIGNGTMRYLAASAGLYVLLACVFGGPLLYSAIKRLP